MSEPDSAGVAAGWEKWNDWNSENMRPVMDLQCRVAGIGPGQVVLDVASGMGLPALLAAELAGASGRVLGVDTSSEMVAGATRIARARGAGNIEFRVMDAHDLDLPDQSFDAATFSFGLMFCGDRPRALRELLRVLKPGARFALAVWDVPASNPFFTTVFGTLSAFLPPPPTPQAPAGPSMFDLGQPGALEELGRTVGLERFSVERVPMLMEFTSLEQHFALFADMAPPLKNAARNLPESTLAELKQALAAAVAPYMEGARIRLPATALVASAARE